MFLIALNVKRLQIKVFENPVYLTLPGWKEAQWIHVLKGDELLKMAERKTWLTKEPQSRGYGHSEKVWTDVHVM